MSQQGLIPTSKCQQCVRCLDTLVRIEGGRHERVERLVERGNLKFAVSCHAHTFKRRR